MYRDAGGLFFGDPWLDAWEQTTIETIESRTYVPLATDPTPRLPLYLTRSTPFWSGYERDVDIGAIWDAPVVFTPSLYSFYSPLELLQDGELEAALQAAVEQATAWQPEALVLANLQQATAQRCLDQLPAAIPIRLDTTFALDLPPTSADYFASLKRNHRADLRRRWRRATERGVTFLELEGDASLDRLPEFVEIANESAVRHGILPLYDLATLRALASLPQARLITAEHDGAMLGGFYAFVEGDCLVLWSGGIKHDAVREFSPYIFLLYEVLEKAFDRGLRSIEFGRGNYDFKRRHGFDGVELWSLVYPIAASEASLRSTLREMHNRFTTFMDLLDVDLEPTPATPVAR
jgi:hypothetical protein